MLVTDSAPAKLTRVGTSTSVEPPFSSTPVALAISLSVRSQELNKHSPGKSISARHSFHAIVIPRYRTIHDFSLEGGSGFLRVDDLQCV